MSDEERQSGQWDDLIEEWSGKALVAPCIDRVNMYASCWLATKQ
jgi:hypothetical protein